MPTQKFDVRDWVIQTNKSSILDSEGLEKFEKELNVPILPEMIFGNNFVVLTHTPSNSSINFYTAGSLKDWALHCYESTLQVAYSAGWSEKRKDLIEKMVKQSYDWTFTTRFMGELTSQVSKFSNPERTDEKIPIHLLTRPEPILFFEEIVLFEDELADNGSAMVTIKLRVMPSCFFLLQRFFLRVDDVLFRVIDTRVFHEFGKPYVLREYQEKSCSSEELVAANEELSKDKGKFVDQNLIASLLPLRECYMEKLSLIE